MSAASRPRWPTVTLALALVLAALFAACSERRPPAFPHRAHLSRSECGGPGQRPCLNCNSCHAPAGIERRHGGGMRCEACHEDGSHGVAELVFARPEKPYGQIAFDHDRHLAMPGLSGQCVPCHAGVVEAGRPPMPPMKQCFTCHEHQSEWDRGVCTPCHERGDLTRLLPQTFLRHEGGFDRAHGRLVMQNEQLCQSCHSQSDCDSCHDSSQPLLVEARRPEAVERSFVHRAGFLTRHAMEAQAEPGRCVTCHSVNDCDSCHIARGVSAALLSAGNPHPPGWVGGVPGAKSFHGTAARRDIVSCAGCHDQGPLTNCIRCHQVGGPGGNPHPGGSFTSSRSPSESMCRYCHG